MERPYNIMDEIDPCNILQQHADNFPFVNEWDEFDEEEECVDSTLDEAFNSWEDVNGMFFTRF